jgi:5-methylcytosine-specific restriction endonuclease McrA
VGILAPAISSDPPTPFSSLPLVGLILLVLFIGIAGLVRLRSMRAQKIVLSSSEAIRRLEELNRSFQSRLTDATPIEASFSHHAPSKARFERFDLVAFLQHELLTYEDWFEREVRARADAISVFGAYVDNVSRISAEALGRSADPRLRIPRLQALELKLFVDRQLKEPFPRARVTATVRYTSPKGRKVYTRQLEWDYFQLRTGLKRAKSARAQQNSSRALKDRERSLMTSSMRSEILRRDGFRCRMCGATPADGVTLHVDHITPISHGGLTETANLQTLCADCNLGKGNRFIG